ncbi:MAG: CocE/NonD family hydrolase [Clostridiales bacterium]|nr:CocE/NonD family hydrolase [Clostridiales bacterium]
MAMERFKMRSKTIDNFDVTYMRHDSGPGYKNPKMIWPELKTETRLLKKGTQAKEGFRPLACDILYKKDVPIPMRDGVTLYGDLFCPTDESKQYPIILCWTTYGKIDPPNNYDVYINRAEMKEKLSSGLDSFEAAEPDYWVKNEFILAVVDARGTTHSEGIMNQSGMAEARDLYDVIEWLGTQEWSNGKVGMSGNSQLAQSQYFAATLQPPHLGAIAPWEACSDWYRDQVCRGGIFSGGLFAMIGEMLRLQNGIEDIFTMLVENPLMNDYWKYEKRPNFSMINVPAYFVASWTSNVHPYGTMRAYNLCSSKDKWLRVHNTQEWPDLQTPKYRDELRDFFNHYLRGEENGWEKTPRVRVSLLDPFGPDHVDVPVENFPLPGTEYRKVYLDAASKSLSYKPFEEESACGYTCRKPSSDVVDPFTKRTYTEVIKEGDGLTQFRITFTEDTTLCGYFKAHMFMSCDESADDIDLFMYVTKEDSLGVADYPVVLGVNFMGAEARLRLSHRKIENRDVYDWRHAHDEEEMLTPGVPVEFETIFWPLGMIWRKGETMVLTVSSRELQYFEIPTPPIPTRNKGTHTIHTGGKFNSYIEIPVVDIK